MFDGTLYQIQEAYTHVQDHRQGEQFWAICTAQKLYRRARQRCLWTKLRSCLTGQPYALLDLDAVRAVCALRASYYVGMRSVAIDRILGSEGRCQDFDRGFLPLRTHTKDRWLRIAVASLMREPLSPVTLVLVGGRYFVLDGHHRISVARALGQAEVDAEVTVCEFAGPLPWEQAVPAHCLAHQPV